MLPFFCCFAALPLCGNGYSSAVPMRLRRGALGALGALGGVIGFADAAIADKVE